jgi:hypothetical protein
MFDARAKPLPRTILRVADLYTRNAGLVHTCVPVGYARLSGRCRIVRLSRSRRVRVQSSIREAVNFWPQLENQGGAYHTETNARCGKRNQP